MRDIVKLVSLLELFYSLSCICVQRLNGSPVWPLLHVQIGIWLSTWQFAFKPHEPIHGSRHFWLMQANWLGHSALITHSGLHDGGEPMKSGKQEHTGTPFCIWHCELGPHGVG